MFHNNAANKNGGFATIPVEEGAVEEEQVATIHTVPIPNAELQSKSKSDISTPQRKISTSRFMNAFQQFYTDAISSTIGVSKENEDGEEISSTPVGVASRTPTKGVESKLLSMWHNVKYGWNTKIKSNFSKEQPVWLLGRCYHRKYTPPSMESSAEFSAIPSNMTSSTSEFCASDPKTISVASDTIQTQILPNNSSLYPLINPQNIEELIVPQELGTDAVENQVAENPWEEGIEGFRKDFYSRLWMTYRREFPTMNGSQYTSDCGWGCMLRSGQMLLAQGLICHFLGRSWRFDPDAQLSLSYEDTIHRKIIKWFGDSSSKSSPFSIHALVSLGEKMGKKPGDWYGPASVAFLLQQCLQDASKENADFDNIAIYVAKNCTVYIEDVKDVCCVIEPDHRPNVPWQSVRKNDSAKVEMQQWKSLIVLIPLRLGTEKLNPVYAHCLKLLLSTEYCIGIIGGRPKHSLFFVGFQEDKLIHLDPHYCQEMVDVNQENFPLHTFHCKSPRKLKTSKMDPSCCIGFYCPTKTDFDHFVESVQLYLHPMRCASGTIDKVIAPSQHMPNASYNDGSLLTSFTEMNYPLFSFSNGRCLDHEKEELSESIYKPLQQQVAQYREELTGCQVNLINSYDDDDGETEEFVLL